MVDEIAEAAAPQPHTERITLPPSKSLFITFEGERPEGAFMTAFSSKEAAERFCEARSKRFPCYWDEYQRV